MRKKYESPQSEKVGLYQSILENAGILTLLKNDNSLMAPGGMLSTFHDDLPSLWVMDDNDYDKAIEILTPYYENTEPPPANC